MSTVKNTRNHKKRFRVLLYALDRLQNIIRYHIGFVVCPSASEFAEAVFPAACKDENSLAFGIMSQNNLILAHVTDHKRLRKIY